jgi:hypothetical protein
VGNSIVEALLVLLIVQFVFRYIERIWDSRYHPTEPDDETYVHARLKPRPKLDSGAVALEEPDEDEEEQQ